MRENCNVIHDGIDSGRACHVCVFCAGRMGT